MKDSNRQPEPDRLHVECPICGRIETHTHPDEEDEKDIQKDAQRQSKEDREREMFGCTEAAIDQALEGKEPRDVAMFAMGTLSNAQELIQCSKYEGQVEWSVADRNANTIRQLMNVAKYAIDKAVPR